MACAARGDAAAVWQVRGCLGRGHGCEEYEVALVALGSDIEAGYGSLRVRCVPRALHHWQACNWGDTPGCSWLRQGRAGR